MSVRNASEVSMLPLSARNASEVSTLAFECKKCKKVSRPPLSVAGGIRQVRSWHARTKIPTEINFGRVHVSGWQKWERAGGAPRVWTGVNVEVGLQSQSTVRTIVQPSQASIPVTTEGRETRGD